jgi:hypothetical protein
MGNFLITQEMLLWKGVNAKSNPISFFTADEYGCNGGGVMLLSASLAWMAAVIWFRMEPGGDSAGTSGFLWPLSGFSYLTGVSFILMGGALYCYN